jgi:hypothetical protein
MHRRMYRRTDKQTDGYIQVPTRGWTRMDRRRCQSRFHNTNIFTPRHWKFYRNQTFHSKKRDVCRNKSHEWRHRQYLRRHRNSSRRSAFSFEIFEAEFDWNANLPLGIRPRLSTCLPLDGIHARNVSKLSLQLFAFLARRSPRQWHLNYSENGRVHCFKLEHSVFRERTCPAFRVLQVPTDASLGRWCWLFENRWTCF